MKKVAIVLSGCGVYDGAEIHEAVMLLYACQKEGAQVSFFAPDIDQAGVVNHLDGSVSEGAKRNVLEESARIARGDISPLSKFDSSRFDALFFAGGFGAAKNLCSFAFDGADCSVNPDVEKAVCSMVSSGKPQGFVCISPVIAARVLGNRKVKLTIGSDTSTAAAVEKMGARHVNCSVDEYCFDEELKVYSTPAYMLAKNTVELFSGIFKMVSAALR